jgi:hypothetical protein
MLQAQTQQSDEVVSCDLPQVLGKIPQSENRPACRVLPEPWSPSPWRLLFAGGTGCQSSGKIGPVNP